VCSDGLYVGELSEDQSQLHGRGVMKWFDGNRHYIGDWKNGSMCGKGIYYKRDSYIYEGDWLGGLRHGKGVYKWSSGGLYEGDWRNGSRNGFGIFYYPPTTGCDYYKGEWKDSKMHGKGEMRWKDGLLIRGEWADGVLNGEAEICKVNGSVSSGNHLNGYKEGQGSFVDSVFGYTFEGLYTHDERREGTIRWLNGDSWVGCYFPEVVGDDSGEQESEGVMTFAESGNTLRGRWVDIPLRNGKGQMVMWLKAENREVIGEWVDGKFRELPKDQQQETKRILSNDISSNDQVTAESDNGQGSI